MLQSILYTIFIFFFSLFFLSPTFSASLSFSPQSITVWPNCPVIATIEVSIKQPTNAIDIKIMKDETLYTVRDFSLSWWVLDTYSDVTTWIALSGTFAWQEYYYAFGMVQWDETLVGSHSVWTITIIPAPWVETIRVPFYMIPWRAWDDSTISHLSWQIMTDILQVSESLVVYVDDSLVPCQTDTMWFTWLLTASWFSLTEKQHNTSILSNISARIYLFGGLWILLLLILLFFAKKRSSD